MTDDRPAARPATAYIEQLKQLKARRGETPKEKLDAIKAGNKAQHAVLAAIADEAKTVPEIAEQTGLPAQEVFWWVTALRKYNRVQDERKRGDYVAYRKK